MFIMNPVEHDISELSGGTKRRMVWQAWLLLLTGLIVTALATRYTQLQEEEEEAKEFNSVCNEIEGKILDRLNAHQQILRSGAAFYEHSVYVTRQEWHDFTERQKIEQELPGIQGIGFARLIPRQKLAQHVQQMRDEGFPAYKVWPDGEREMYSSIIYLEPFKDRNLRAFGYDMLSEPVRRAAMKRARDTDSATLSGKVILKQENDQDVQAGTLMYVPVYRKGLPHETIEQRRAALLGWVYSPYRMDDLMRGILGRWDLTNNQRIHLKIFDGKQATPDMLLYDSYHANTVSQMTLQRSLISAGRQWTLNFTRPAASITEYVKVWLVLFGGTITSFLLAGLFFNLYNTTFKARQLAKRLTTDLQDSTARLAQATEVGGVGIWEYDVIHNKLTWDAQMFLLYGLHREQFIGAYEAWSAVVHSEDRERAEEELKKALRGEKEFNTEFSVLWPDGSTHYIRALARVQRNTAGQAVRMIGTNWDISVLKQAEQKIKLKNEELQKSNAEKDKFFSIIAHDLHGPLSSFAGLTEIMADEASNLNKEEIQKFSVCMRDSASNTYRLLENLLTWAISQQGLAPFKPEIVELLPVIKECIGLMLESAKNKDIKITCGAPDNIAVFADRNMLQTVIRNLISNAVKFTTKGGIISVSVKITDNRDVEVAVIDSGIGMDSATIEKLFRIDIRSSRLGTNGEHGTGIGLSLCKEFIEKMSGRIRVESEEGKGTEFYFTVPCNSEHGSRSIAENIAPAVEGKNQFKNMKILIVEDDEKSEILIKIFVRKFAREILIARTGVEALEICRKTPDIDLILMDIEMPEMDGYEATSKIREFNKDVIIIVQTAYASDREREKSIAAGCNDYITKPFDKTSLTALLKKYS
jgi:PAS domain S-box-containing protein